MRRAAAGTVVLLCTAATLVLAAVALVGCTPGESLPASSPTTSILASESNSPAAPGSSQSGDPIAAGAAEPFPLNELGSDMLKGNFAICADCHSLLDKSGVEYVALVASFRHRFHLEQGALCADCHAVPTHTKEGIRTPPMEKCFSCHSLEDPSAPPGECAACHPDDFPLTPASHDDPKWLPAADLRESERGLHSFTKLDDRREECGVCHGPTFCQDCHKVEMPHPGGWQENHVTEAKKVGGSACNLCHLERQVCAECHHTGYEQGGPPWIELHPMQALAEGQERCIGCHSTKTCAHCHVTGEYTEYD